ncbi:MAG: hypothetical protein NZ583_03815 [Desulfobacterota bacterium]|nr:hypothetical protein [Thermodesulfobacteriota bacterium]
MLLITHYSGEPCGLLGPQRVATYLSKLLSYPVIVIGLKRGFNFQKFLRYLEEHYRNREKIILFSYHCGRPDIFELARVLKTLNYRLVLGGPQAQKDAKGEPNVERYSHRIKGLLEIFNLVYSGPVDGMDIATLCKKEGLVLKEWEISVGVTVDWHNFYSFDEGLKKVHVKEAQVLRSIGCPYALKTKSIRVDPPNFIPDIGEIEIETSGCSFCDVAWDKGYKGTLKDEKVFEQIENLPEIEGKKIPFELIDEYPLSFLPKLLAYVQSQKIRLMQINLVLRADDILKNCKLLERSLFEMGRLKVKLLLSSVGFESFSDRILKNLNKGITASENLAAIRIMRELKKNYPDVFFYARQEGANHGFIHPTPWDSEITRAEIQSAIGAYDLTKDILPHHSTPLIIHHGCALGEWLRKIEERHSFVFGRQTNIIEWWEWKRD